MPSKSFGLIGRYQVLQPLGQGGMGSIYLAQDPKIGNRAVVIKLLRDGFDDRETRERFASEANAAGALHHPNIVTIFDVGEYEGQPFIAMEYIKGRTLTEMIEQRPRLSLVRKIELLEELCAGLDYAHKSGVVHRDIKPANLMLSERGVLKVVDFGLARLRSAPSGITRAGMVVGTLNYMAPEQMAGDQIDARADIFAFGAVMYELLSYRRAFQGDFPSIIHTILTASRQPLAALVPDLDPALTAIVDKCLAVKPDDRWSDLDVVRGSLREIRERLAGDEVTHDEADLVFDEPRHRPSTQQETVVLRASSQEGKRAVRETLTPGRLAGMTVVIASMIAGWIMLQPSNAASVGMTPSGLVSTPSRPRVPASQVADLGAKTEPVVLAPANAGAVPSVRKSDALAAKQRAWSSATPETTAPSQTFAPTASSSDDAAARSREQALQALDNGARLETDGDLPAALEQFETARRLDPSSTAVDHAVARVKSRMKAEGTTAFKRGEVNEAFDRIDEAITAFETAVKYLPDDDANKQVARTRLHALRAQG